MRVVLFTLLVFHMLRFGGTKQGFSFRGEDETLLDKANKVTLKWYLYPGTVKVLWVRCFKSNTTDEKYHFFTLDNMRPTNWTAESMRFKLHEATLRGGKDRPIMFSLVLAQPKESDSGYYCCELCGSVLADNLVANLLLRVYASSDQDSVDTTRQSLHVTSLKTSTVDITIGVSGNSNETLSTGETRQRFPWMQVSIIICTIFLIGITAFISLYKFWNNRKRPISQLQQYSDVEDVSLSPAEEVRTVILTGRRNDWKADILEVQNTSGLTLLENTRDLHNEKLLHS